MNAETPASLAPARPRRLPLLAGFLPAFLWGLRSAMRWQRLLLVGGITAGIAFLIGSQAVGVHHWGRPRDAWFDLWWLLDDSVLFYLLPIIAMVTAARGFSGEVSQRTLVYHLVRPISRTTLLLARYASGVIPAALVTTAVLYATCLGSGLSIPASVWIALPATALVGAIAVGAVYYAFSALFRFGMIVALIYTFVFEPLFAGQRGAMQKLSIMFHVRGVHHGLTSDAFAEKSTNVAAALEPQRFDPKQIELWNSSSFLEIAERVAYDPPAVAAFTTLLITLGVLAFTAWRIARRDFALKD